MNKILEINKRISKGGRKNIRMVLLTIHEEGEMNRNGITWVEQYVLDNLESIKGIPICATFLDEDKEDLYDHGYTETVESEEGKSEPLFLNSESVGVIEDAKIEVIEIDGETKKVLVGYGYIFCQRYPNLCEKLESSKVKSSIEIMGTDENNRKIIYDGGYKEKGRKPMVFDFTGTCLLGVLEADENCYVLEVAENKNKEEKLNMDENKIIEVIQKAITETNAVKADTETKIAELNSQIEAKDAEIKEANEAKEVAENNASEKDSKIAELEAENAKLKEELAACKKREACEAFDAMLANYTDDEKKCVESEINAYKENPLDGNADEIISKICRNIVENQKKAEADAKIAEQNEAKENETIDIFSEVNSDEEKDEDTNIF
ncbi:MAG: hypothetical protein SOW31_08630 [Treponema sp.]|nr:hypothetical protein [Treponema sp.]